MTYNGRKIRRPSIAIIKQYIAKKCYDLDAEKIYNICDARNWKNAQGRPIRKLETVIDLFQKDPIKRENAKLQPTTNAIIENASTSKKVNRPKKKKKYIPYNQQLQDKRWFRFRLKVFKIRGSKCECCSSMDNIQVHHIQYSDNMYAWEYDFNEVRVLCRNCHKKAHAIDLDEAMDLAMDLN